MARFLFATIPFTGHVNPGLPIAQELVARGHEVRWYTSRKHRAAIERMGARFVPMNHAFEIDDTTLDKRFPERASLKGLAQLQHDLEKVFIDITPGMLRDLEEEIERHPVDVVVGDNACAAAALLSERHHIAWAVFGISVLTLGSRDTAPFGLALYPSSSKLGRLRNAALQKLVDNFVFRNVNRHYAAMRQSLGFPESRYTLFNEARNADLYLQNGVEDFEYPRTDMPEQLRFVGSIIPEAPPTWTKPSWWNELDGSRRVVLVTQGTIANDFHDVIHPAIRGLAHEDVLVIVTTGSKPARDIGLETLPLNVRVAQFIPYAELMPKVDLLVTNGGYGSIQIALAHGVPVVACGGTEEKPEIANRVQWSGVGVGIRKKTAGFLELRQKVMQVLSDDRYRARARELAAKLAKIDPRTESANLLEELAAQQAEEAAA
jgi:MGT family glycosyltransferase